MTDKNALIFNFALVVLMFGRCAVKHLKIGLSAHLEIQNCWVNGSPLK